MAHEGEEILIGTMVSRACKGYSEDLPTPTWQMIVEKVQQYQMHNLLIIFVGKIYRSGSKCGGCSGYVTNNDITRTPFETEAEGKEVTTVDVAVGFVKAFFEVDPEHNTPLFAQHLLKLDEAPLHIVGVVLKKID
jgi:hypothetical protein